jgi:hypothetical protein
MVGGPSTSPSLPPYCLLSKRKGPSIIRYAEPRNEISEQIIVNTSLGREEEAME